MVLMRDARSATGEREHLARTSRHPAGVRSPRRPLFFGSISAGCRNERARCSRSPFYSVIVGAAWIPLPYRSVQIALQDFATGSLPPSHEATARQATMLGMTGE